uniref:Uncharacterized protein LOC110198770 n=1 Tax=Phascolarctos cinereus TaxID=38626 RepID=A0A6P5J6B1_PHACI|nr:uncharacterized protein LOC110198770 [Phascolarctos cinereus]
MVPEALPVPGPGPPPPPPTPRRLLPRRAAPAANRSGSGSRCLQPPPGGSVVAAPSGRPAPPCAAACAARAPGPGLRAGGSWERAGPGERAGAAAAAAAGEEPRRAAGTDVRRAAARLRPACPGPDRATRDRDVTGGLLEPLPEGGSFLPGTLSPGHSGPLDLSRDLGAPTPLVCLGPQLPSWELSDTWGPLVLSWDPQPRIFGPLRPAPGTLGLPLSLGTA